MGRNDAIINGVIPVRGMYLVNHDKVRTYGRVTSVRADGTLFWFSYKDGNTITSPDPWRLANDGIGYSAKPLPDYVPHATWPFPFKHPDKEPTAYMGFGVLREAALLAAELGRYKRAELLFRAAGLDEAADMCKRGTS